MIPKCTLKRFASLHVAACHNRRPLMATSEFLLCSMHYMYVLPCRCPRAPAAALHMIGTHCQLRPCCKCLSLPTQTHHRATYHRPACASQSTPQGASLSFPCVCISDLTTAHCPLVSWTCMRMPDNTTHFLLLPLSAGFPSCCT